MLHKMSRLSVHHHRLNHRTTLRLQTTWNYHFPTNGEYCMNLICFSYNWTHCYTKIFLPNCLYWWEALVLMTCWSCWQLDKHFHIPCTSTRIQGYHYSRRIGCNFWKTSIALKSRAFSQIYPESLIVILKTDNFISIYCVKYVSQFPQ